MSPLDSPNIDDSPLLVHEYCHTSVLPPTSASFSLSFEDVSLRNSLRLDIYSFIQFLSVA
jgi:hypothetical protein